MNVSKKSLTSLMHRTKMKQLLLLCAKSSLISNKLLFKKRVIGDSSEGVSRKIYYYDMAYTRLNEDDP
jgi:hypothetical protein